MKTIVSQYRGSEKHKNRPGHGAKGTLCPEWTHTTSQAGLQNDPFRHNWADTEAHRLFENADHHPDGEERRYATKDGIAFEAKPTNDGAWHGYPIPWQSVPDAIVDKWLHQGAVSPKQLKKYGTQPKSNIRWALETDSR